MEEIVRAQSPLQGLMVRQLESTIRQAEFPEVRTSFVPVVLGSSAVVVHVLLIVVTRDFVGDQETSAETHLVTRPTVLPLILPMLSADGMDQHVSPVTTGTGLDRTPAGFVTRTSPVKQVPCTTDLGEQLRRLVVVVPHPDSTGVFQLSSVMVSVVSGELLRQERVPELQSLVAAVTMQVKTGTVHTVTHVQGEHLLVALVLPSTQTAVVITVVGTGTELRVWHLRIVQMDRSARILQPMLRKFVMAVTG